MDELTNRNARTQLLCSDVARIELERLEMEDEQERDESEEIRELSADGGSLPDALRVMLFADDGKNLLFWRDVILR